MTCRLAAMLNGTLGLLCPVCTSSALDMLPPLFQSFLLGVLPPIQLNPVRGNHAFSPHPLTITILHAASTVLTF